MAAPTRKRVGGSSKGKRWRKGQSSSSNPETSTHRQAARSRITNLFGGSQSNQGSRNSQLTQDALRKHEQSFTTDLSSSSVKQRSQCDVDITSPPPAAADNYNRDDGLSINSCDTFISGWSQCTNETFHQVEHFWNSNSAQAKEICAILAAVAEVIRSNGGKETETEYFAALMTVLDTVEGEESLSAAAYLLRVVIKRVPHSVLKIKFSDVGKKLFDVLGRHAATGSPMLLKSILLCFASLFRVQEPVVWSEQSTLQLYHGLLSFISHPKPKVRKAAHIAVCSVLKGSQFLLNDDGPDHHPAAGVTAKLCQQLIEQQSVSKDDTVVLYVLGLLKDVMSVFPQQYVKSTCELILKLMTLSNVLVCSVAMQALHGLFISLPKTSCLSSQLNAQIINALYDYQPTENDSQPAKAWLAVMSKAHTNLHRQDEKLCVSHLPRFFNSAMSYLLSHRPDINKAALDTMKSLLYDCIRPSSALIELSLRNTPNDSNTPIHKVIRCIESGLQYKYNTCWHHVLEVIRTTFEVLGKICPDPLRKCLRSMCELRHGYNFPFTAELDRAVGTAVKVIGPRFVLTAVPLDIDGTAQDDMNFPNSWLFPVIRDHVENTELKYFNDYFLPLAVTLYKTAGDLKESKRLVEAKAYDVLQYQIWTMLPGFLTNPVDLPTEFKNIAKVLGAALSNRPDIRNEICTGLRTVIKKSCHIDENKQAMAAFSKNYLPILFNIYTTAPAEDGGPTTLKSQLPILDTVRSYLSISEPKVIHELFDKASSRISSSDEVASYTRYTVMDLLIAMIPYINMERLDTVLKSLKPLLKNKDRTVQKKAYRLLERACCENHTDTDSASCFLKTNLCLLQDLLVSVRKQCKPASRAPRLHCFSAIVKRMPVEHEEFINVILQEAVDSTKAVGLRARTAALDLVCDMARYVIKSAELCHNPSIDAFDDYIEMILAGFTEEPATITASIVALQCLMREFRMYLSTELISKILDRLCSQLHTNNTGIIKTTLECIKDMMKHINDRELAQHIEKLVKSLVRWDEATKHKFRYQVRPLFLRMCRKFGFEMIDNLAPASYHKMIINMKKTTEREKRHKMQKESGDQDMDDDWTTVASTKRKAESFDEILAETDSDEEEMVSVRTEKSNKSTRSQKKSRLPTWLVEGVSDAPIDFLDPSAAKRISATKPEDQTTDTRRKTKHTFLSTDDGKLIIKDDEEDVEDADKRKIHWKLKNKQGVMEADDSDDENAAAASNKAGNKRKVSDNVESSSSRAPGGNKKQRHTKYGTEYKSKKAPGDVKLKGRPDPYAYIPLNRQTLNRRKKAKLAGQYLGMVKATRRGAAKAKRAISRKMKNPKH